MSEFRDAYGKHTTPEAEYQNGYRDGYDAGKEESAAENVRLRDALITADCALDQVCHALDIDTAETLIRISNCRTGKVLAERSLADIFAQTRAALVKQGEN